jgi:hypothetical protein
VVLLPGIISWHNGGQPFDFHMLKEHYAEWEKVYHLGYRHQPTKQLTLETADVVDFKLDLEALALERSIFGSVESLGTRSSRLLLHGTRICPHTGNPPAFWDALEQVYPFLTTRFNEIVFIGSESDRRIYSRWEGATHFDDGGDWLKLVDFMQDSTLLIGCGSSNVALAGCVKLPTIRIHDPIGAVNGGKAWDADIFANLGPKQYNLPPDTNYAEEIAKVCGSLQ